MRPQGRSPSFFIVGLFLAVAILGFNYWSLSKRNHDLAAQLLNMQDQLRLCISKRMTVERRGSTIVNELKKCETALDMDKNEVARKESEVISLTEQLKNKEFQIKAYEMTLKEMEELRMSLKTCEENNNGITEELQKKKEELKANQPNGVNAELCKHCKDQWVFDQNAFITGIDKVLGPSALLQLKNAGVDIGNHVLEISSQQKNDQLLKNNEAQQNLPVNNVSIVSRSADNQETRKAAVPSETGQNAGAAGSNTIVGVNPANSINKVANSLAANDGVAGQSSNKIQGNAVPNNNNEGGVDNQGRVVAPANNKEDAIENPGAVALPANNNEGAIENPGAVALPANNNVAGNPAAVVPVNNNDGVVPVPIIQNAVVGEAKGILSQNNNDAVIENPGPAPNNNNVPLLNNNNEGGDVGVADNLDSGNVAAAADKQRELDVAGGNLIPAKSLHGNGAPAGNLNAVLGDNYVNQPKIESNALKSSFLDILKNNNILSEKQFNDSKLPAVQNGPNSNVKEDNLKGGINAIEDSIDKMQKNMNLDEDKMNSLDKNH